MTYHSVNIYEMELMCFFGDWIIFKNFKIFSQGERLFWGNLL